MIDRVFAFVDRTAKVLGLDQNHRSDTMLDLLNTLRSVDSTANNNAPVCSWQDLPGRVKRDSEGQEVPLTASYKQLLRRLQGDAPAVIEALDGLATAANQAGQADAARDTRVAGGWLRRLGRWDFTSTTWDADYSRLCGFWTCLRDVQMELETAVRHDRTLGQDLPLSVVSRYVTDLAQLQPEIDKIERSRTTLVQRALCLLGATMVALRMRPVVEYDEFWQEGSVGSTTG